MLAYSLKKFSDFCFIENSEFVEYFCKMPPKKRSRRRGSQERMSTQVQARSPELEETQQSQQAAGVEVLVRLQDTEEGDIALETQQDSESSDKDIADTQVTQAAGGHRRARAKARASQRQGRGNMYRKRRLTKEARKLLFCSVLRRSRN